MSQPTTDSPRRPLGDVPRRIIITVLVIGSLVGIVLVGQMAVTGGNETSEALPDSVDRLIPASGSEVLRQSQVGIDVADGYDAYLQINDTDIRTAEDGLIRDLGTGLILFQPGPGRPVEKLNSDQNCMIAFVYEQLDGPQSAQPVSWCFQAT